MRGVTLGAGSPCLDNHGRFFLRPFQPAHYIIHSGSRCQRSSTCSASADDSLWWSSMSKRSPQGPVPAMPPPPPTSVEDINKELMGEKAYSRYERVRREERQRVWDNMRRIARQRLEAGLMPEWFDPRLLDVEEAPGNTYWREKGLPAYQYDDTWLGGSGSGGAGGSGGGGQGGGRGGCGWRWWREEDPYWPLRDWGDHPMRWWTFAFAALLAAGGLGAYIAHSSSESLQLGLCAASALSICAAAMSDLRTGWGCALAVKASWAICLAIAAKDYWGGWQHQRSRQAQREPSLGGCGAAAAAMCVLYMVTGMSGLSDVALPMNPGAAFKLEDVAKKHKVWEDWGYGDITMRG